MTKLAFALAIALGAISVQAGAQPQTEPTRVIFDTDMYTDIDDMMALAMVHTLQDRGEMKLLAVTISTEAKSIPPYIDAIDTYYGHGDVPIGMVHGGVPGSRFDKGPQWYAPGGDNYTTHIAELRDAKGAFVFPHRLVDGAKVDDATSLLRRVLAAQPDHSVVLIQVGFSTNLARLLDSKPDKASSLDGYALVKQKVRFLSAMCGNFRETTDSNGKRYPPGQPEWNLLQDVPSAQELFSKWPTPTVVSGFEIGAAMSFPLTAAEHDFGYAAHQPIRDTYLYVHPAGKQGGDHPTFDLTAVLFAARPDRGYFGLSNPGTITVSADGGSKFEEAEGGLRRYLIQTPEQRAKALEAMTMLVTEPPSTFSNALPTKPAH